MTFVSLEFFVFLLIVFALYHATASINVQNFIIAAASCVFYGFWDWRFLSLLGATAVVSYIAAILIEDADNDRMRRIYLWLAVSIGLGCLGFFKYFNFFLEGAEDFLFLFGLNANSPALDIILPLGISFMTFQGLAYVIDVYRGTLSADRDFIRVLAFKSFFPQLVAGPIERAGNLLDQFQSRRYLTLEKVQRGVWLMIVGFAMKIVLADSLAPIVDNSFDPKQEFGWSTVLATLIFGIQIYTDFCGYSLIAKGTALLFGFELIWNFRFPYWSTSISEFWRRWHIGLSTWLRDYLYIPLGGNRRGDLLAARNMLITMVLGGLWHGASWNFVLWGLLHGAALGIWRYAPIPTSPATRTGKILGWLTTMGIVFCGWFLFRAVSLDVMVAMVASLQNWEWVPSHYAMIKAIVSSVLLLVTLEWLLQTYGDYFPLKLNPLTANLIYSALVMATLVMAGGYQASFIYFQF